MHYQRHTHTHARQCQQHVLTSHTYIATICLVYALTRRTHSSSCDGYYNFRTAVIRTRNGVRQRGVQESGVNMPHRQRQDNYIGAHDRRSRRLRVVPTNNIGLERINNAHKGRVNIAHWVTLVGIAWGGMNVLPELDLITLVSGWN